MMIEFLVQVAAGLTLSAGMIEFLTQAAVVFTLLAGIASMLVLLWLMLFWWTL